MPIRPQDIDSSLTQEDKIKLKAICYEIDNELTRRYQPWRDLELWTTYCNDRVAERILDLYRDTGWVVSDRGSDVQYQCNPPIQVRNWTFRAGLMAYHQ